MSKRTVLLDGDYLLWSITSALEVATDWGFGVWTLHCDEEEAKQQTDVWLAELLKTLDADNLRIALTDYHSSNWRKGVLETYKANRKAGRKPVCYWALREYLQDLYSCTCYPTLEADDILGLWATNPKVKGEKIVVGEDKDFRSIPGKHYNPEKPDEGISDISLEQADRFHLYQTLCGDRVDGYTGCPGVGDVGANRALDAECSWESVLRIYASKGLDEAAALQQARVARILRHGEYSRKSGAVKLWSPPLVHS